MVFFLLLSLLKDTENISIKKSRKANIIIIMEQIPGVKFSLETCEKEPTWLNLRL